MNSGIFLTIKDLQTLLGDPSYRTANRLHLFVRKALGKRSRYLTIKEYCHYEGLDFNYIWTVLRKVPLKE